MFYILGTENFIRYIRLSNIIESNISEFCCIVFLFIRTFQRANTLEAVLLLVEDLDGESLQVVGNVIRDKLRIAEEC